MFKDFKLLPYFFLIGILFLFFSCGGGARQAETTMTPMDDTLSPDEKAKEEAEIMKLLGISDEEQKTTETPMQQTPLEDRVNELEKKLKERDMTISSLVNENEQQQNKINEFEREISSLKQGATMGARPVDVSTGNYKARYDNALNMYLSGNYNGAMRLYKELLNLGIEHELNDNCQYWIGECYYGLKNYRQALMEFEKVFVYSKTEKDDDAQLKLGLCYIMLGENAKAREELNKLLTNYPNSEYIPRGRATLQRLQ